MRVLDGKYIEVLNDKYMCIRFYFNKFEGHIFFPLDDSFNSSNIWSTISQAVVFSKFAFSARLFTKTKPNAELTDGRRRLSVVNIYLKLKIQILGVDRFSNLGLF
jgi:hypothetical protein